MLFKRFRSAIILLFIMATLASALHALEHNHVQEDCQVCTVNGHSNALLPALYNTPVLEIIIFKQPNFPVTRYFFETLSSRTRERAPPIA